ncbi:class C beta-lactamase [Ideonella sp.]|uniref:class C beta-lactamase n=1 Tax=Ideonella sp. TaxID=1929293 RepID=UPI0039C85D0D
MNTTRRPRTRLTATSKPARRQALALIAACLTPLAGWAGEDTDKIRGIVDSTIRPLMAEQDVPGMSVAVTINGQPFFFNYGLASRESGTPVRETTLFELGSVSKTFTATLTAYAQATGKLSLDDHPGRYLPQLKGRAIDKASLLHLGTYTAGGLPLQFPDEVPETHDGMIGYYSQWKPDDEPGVQRQYSNPSIGLLGYITGLAMKADFSEAVEKLIFPGLGLGRSHIRMPDSAMPDYAWGYDQTNKPVRVRPGLLDGEAYGVKSTSSDMIRYVQANIDPSGLAAPLRRAVALTHVGHFKVGPMVQGLGWEQYAYPVSQEQLLAGNAPKIIFDANRAERVTVQPAAAPRLFNKTGSTRGFGAYVAFVPAKKIGVVMLANKNYPIPARVKAGFTILERLAQLESGAR